MPLCLIQMIVRISQFSFSLQNKHSPLLIVKMAVLKMFSVLQEPTLVLLPLCF
jgi:hypothetical protein